MELKTARLTLLIDPNKKAAFEQLCAQQDLTASQVVRQMIRDYLTQHGMTYEPSGAGELEFESSARAARSATVVERSAAKPIASAKGSAKTPGARRRG